MVSYFSYIEHVMTSLHKKVHDFITIIKLVMKFTIFSQKQKKEKEKPCIILFI